MTFMYDSDDDNGEPWLEESDAEEDELLLDDCWSCHQGDLSSPDMDKDEDDVLLFNDSIDSENTIVPVVSNVAHSPQALREQIETIFADAANSLVSNSGQLALQISSRPRSSEDRDVLDENILRHRTICFPGKTPQDAWRFSQQNTKMLIDIRAHLRLAAYMRVLELIHESLIEQVVTTKR